MVASTRYWLPLVGGFTGYPPSHYRLLADAVRRLPDPDALGDLVDMTHVGWFVLHPIAVWRQPEMRAAIVVMPGVTRVADVDGYVLLRVARPPQHPGWYDAIARGPRAGTTVLGTPLVTVPESDARASVVARAQSAGPTRGWLRLDLAVTNNGAGTWPVAVEQTETTPPVVRLDVRWWPAGAPHDDAHAVLHQPAALARDVPGGETLRQTVFLSTPAPPGAYDLAIAVRQANGAAFDDPANRPLNLSVDVGPAAPAGAAP